MSAAYADSVRVLSELGTDFLTHAKLPFEPIPHAADADQMPRHSRIVFDLFAQGHDVVVHHPVRHIEAGTPHFFEEVLAREHASSAAHESGQQLQLGVGGFHTLAVAAQLETRQVQL